MENEKRLDLIDRDQVLRDIAHIGVVSVGNVLQCLRDAKRVDAVEVVHGRFVKVDHYPPECSICGDIAPLTCDGEEHYMGNYCPNCGAKMDGGNAGRMGE